ncbi:AraC family transcriptional regulator [Nocardioides bruguierae]|uniref:AraC family transcriptional regulator n=1 Tax=Nocardioides bruguierae TaxID=2945102 RepID=UPI0020214779|nr:AraC family transcriptional regulator [Nocardioides bruguierae]MCL8025397.1 AraC family transcriptional regulator [Nocardioides bruguierae]
MDDLLGRVRLIDSTRTREPVRPRRRSRGVPNALADHPLVDTVDLAAADVAVSRLLGPAQVLPQPQWRDRFRCRLNAVTLLDLTLAHLDLAVPAEIGVPVSPDCVTVHMTSSGSARVEVDGEEQELSPFHALVVSPGTRYRLTMAVDSPQTIVRIERPAVERQLSRMLGRRLPEPVVFDPVGDLTSDAAGRWTGALSMVFTEVLSPASLVRQGVGAGALEELLISSLLYVHHSNYSALLRSPGTSGRRAVRRAVEYIERHLAEQIRLEDLAEYAQMSTRSIQAGFKEDLGTTPVAYIRDRRLDAVRRTLMESVPGDGLTVTGAASRWGFSHLGSFAGLYRERFGEAPSTTLKEAARA